MRNLVQISLRDVASYRYANMLNSFLILRDSQNPQGWVASNHKQLSMVTLMSYTNNFNVCIDLKWLGSINLGDIPGF